MILIFPWYEELFTLPACSDHEACEVDLPGFMQRPVIDHLRVILGANEKFTVDVQANLQ